MIIKYKDLVSTTSEFHRMTNIEHNGVYVQVSHEVF